MGKTYLVALLVLLCVGAASVVGRKKHSSSSSSSSGDSADNVAKILLAQFGGRDPAGGSSPGAAPGASPGASPVAAPTDGFVLGPGMEGMGRKTSPGKPTKEWKPIDPQRMNGKDRNGPAGPDNKLDLHDDSLKNLPEDAREFWKSVRDAKPVPNEDRPGQPMGGNQNKKGRSSSGAEDTSSVDDEAPINTNSQNPLPLQTMSAGNMKRDSWVYTTTTAPFAKVVKIYFQKSGVAGTFSCSGSMIGPNLVATAGHCVHGGGSTKTWHTGVYVVPGMVEQKFPSWQQEAPFGFARSYQLYSVTAWTTNGNINYDFGWIQLDRNVGSRTGWLGEIHSVSNGQAFNLHGYPGVLYTGNLQYARQWTIANAAIDNNEASSWTWICGGDSGGPWFNTNQQLFAVSSHYHPNADPWPVHCNVPGYGSQPTVPAKGTKLVGVASARSWVGSQLITPVSKCQLNQNVFPGVVTKLSVGTVKVNVLFTATWSLVNVGFLNCDSIYLTYYIPNGNAGIYKDLKTFGPFNALAPWTSWAFSHSFSSPVAFTSKVNIAVRWTSSSAMYDTIQNWAVLGEIQITL